MFRILRALLGANPARCNNHRTTRSRHFRPWCELLEERTTPTIIIGPDQTIQEGGTAHFSATISDIPDYSVEWDFDYDWEAFNADAVDTLTPAHQYPSSGRYVVMMHITDETGEVYDDWLTVTVTNVAPTASVSVSAGPEGAVSTITLANFQDPDPADNFTFWVDWTNSGTFQWTRMDPSRPPAAAFEHVYDDNYGRRRTPPWFE